MPRIDIGAVLAEKAPRLARWVPGFVLRWLRRTIHEPEINYILEHYWNLPPQEFIRACFREWQVTYSVEGLEKLDPKGRYLFASNHPFGGMDGMMLADKLIDRFGDARVVVNDLLMHLEPLRPLWIPVNKHGYKQVSTFTAVDTRLALCTNTDTLTIVNTCRNSDLNLLLTLYITRACTVAALILDNLSGTATIRTYGYGSCHTEQ